MSRYINYDDLDYRNDMMHGKSGEFLDGVIYMAQRIEEAPSIDIVWCKECVRRKKNGFCLEHNRYEKNDNGYCSYGGRKETDHE